MKQNIEVWKLLNSKTSSDFSIIIADKCNKFITKDPPVGTMFQSNNVTIATLKPGAGADWLLENCWKTGKFSSAGDLAGAGPGLTAYDRTFSHFLLDHR